MIKRSLKGSFTVEATFIIPIILVVILVIIYMAFYLHDYCKIRSDITQGISKSHIAIRQPANKNFMDIDYDGIDGKKLFHLLRSNHDEEEVTIEKMILNDLNQGLIISKIEGIETDIGWRKIQIHISASTNFPIPNILRLFYSKNKDIVINIELGNHQPSEFIRIADVLVDTGEKIEGVDALIEGLLKIMP